MNSPSDVLNYFGINKVQKIEIQQKKEKKDIPEEYITIYKTISEVPIHIDEICKKCKMDVGTVSYILTMLELDGHITQIVGKRFIIN